MSLLKSTIRAIALMLSVVMLIACSEPAKNTSGADKGQTDAQQPADKDDTLKTSSSKSDEGAIGKGPAKLEVVQGQQGTKLEAIEGDCGSLSQKACLNSSQCTLEQGKDKGYYCRDANNICEKGFVQEEGMAKSTCLVEKGCKFIPASCFCPEGVQCICGGGKPPACVVGKAGPDM